MSFSLFVFPLLAPFIALLGLIAWRWLPFGRSPTKAFQRQAATACIVTAVLFSVVLFRFAGRLEPTNPWPAWIFAETLCLGALYSFFHLTNMAHTARRIHILLELGEPDPVSYSGEDMLRTRLERMERLGLLGLEGDTYRVRGYLLCFAARLCFSWRRVLFPG